MWLVVFRRVYFDYQKACRRLTEVWGVRFLYCKACMLLVEVGRVCLYYRKARRRFAQFQRICFVEAFTTSESPLFQPQSV